VKLLVEKKVEGVNLWRLEEGEKGTLWALSKSDARGIEAVTKWRERR
jgi:hypothetical protein